MGACKVLCAVAAGALRGRTAAASGCCGAAAAFLGAACGCGGLVPAGTAGTASAATGTLLFTGL